MGIEFELKYRATAQQLGRIREAYPGGTAKQMRTTYYDTPQNHFAARKWTVRHRQEGDQHVCTLKTPAADGVSRGEWECHCPDIYEALPQLARLSGEEELLQLAEGGLVVACGARFTRIAQTLTLGESTAELALDQGELLNGEKVLPFAEVEVELKSGDAEEIRLFARALAARFGLEPEPKSKFYRARLLGQEGNHGL